LNSNLPLLLAVMSTLCFGVAMVTARVGLRHLDARAAAAVSIPMATLLFVAAAPFTIDFASFNLAAVIIFAVVGLFYPALVTLLTFRSNEELGPTVTSAISGTAPLFAMLAAALFLHERVPPQATLAAVGVAAGVALMSWNPRSAHKRLAGKALLWPVAGAILRGFAQAGAKAGLLLWSNPFAASLAGYLISTVTVLGVSQARGNQRRKLTRSGLIWFAITGVLNGSALVLMYSALALAPVSTVAPIIAAYPLVTVIVSAFFLRTEPVSHRATAGAVITVTAIAFLVATIPRPGT